jgi:hypothetical protein
LPTLLDYSHVGMSGRDSQQHSCLPPNESSGTADDGRQPQCWRPTGPGLTCLAWASRPVSRVSCRHAPDHGERTSHPLRPAAEISAVLIGSEQTTASCAPDVPPAGMSLTLKGQLRLHETASCRTTSRVDGTHRWL